MTDDFDTFKKYYTNMFKIEPNYVPNYQQPHTTAPQKQGMLQSGEHDIQKLRVSYKLGLFEADDNEYA